MGVDHREAERAFRPARPRVSRLAELIGRIAAADVVWDFVGDDDVAVTGACLDSRAVQPGDLYIALPGARAHGADFAEQAASHGASAILTDADGRGRAEATGLPVLTADSVRDVVGRVSAEIYGTRPDAPELLGVTGTNGKTTTTYLVRSLLRALGRSTGLVGTIEIVAGETPIPSVLTTPEAPQLHGLMARMREAGIGAAAMEVSSHSLDYRRVAGLSYRVAGFTNLTQDHLDLHGSMEDYFATKAKLFAPDVAASAVVTVDDAWGRRLAAERRAAAGADSLWTLETAAGADRAAGAGSAPDAYDADWRVERVERRGLGHAFELAGPEGRRLRASTGLPGRFNVSNAALAVLMVLASGADAAALQRVLDDADPLTIEVPGRMQVIATAPAAVVDFAHNSDALERAIEAVRGERGGRVVVVFGATGDRDATKRPVMGAVAARQADVVIVTDDDPHGEEPGRIRAEVLAGAREAVAAEGLATEVIESAPRAAAIREAVRLAGPEDTILIAGRGHETVQEIAGVDHALDDRVELRAALVEAGRDVLAEGASGRPGRRAEASATGVETQSAGAERVESTEP
ncbi:UDP-N-acetylmuramoyl-L-alanyl-D-glutamate--2,6-diaminopimelate ligase [Zhihengliuella sp.]|uniref:UDP-N-acetylmuramoyl-L-alanyl-D-glutamate--2, 6-diaminopimelate ligase n=1 Tax=Zhihengliuella sp. TaxID=1954483 RepID=UPI002810B77E|nr:UDP-N-acetylmuramoyl-L-alanyl-D-glutamate--2,6-diaminopimelate ligase [Zhihengliuella sp.]